MKQLLKLLLSFGLVAVFGGMILESVGIPLPSEIILPFAGYLVYQGKAGFWAAVLVGTLGGTVGSLLAYGLGLWGGRPLLERYGRYILIREEELRRAERWFARYGAEAVFFGRLLPAVRTYISFPPGITRMRLPLFTIYTLAGSLIWSVVLTYAGVILGPRWESLRRLFDLLDVLIVVLVLGGVIYFFRRRRQGRGAGH